MAFLRLGTRVAVLNEANEVLLMKRGDSGNWELPGGRVDKGELIHVGASREVREETGIETEIVRPIGLYYQQGRNRLNLLYRAQATGGELLIEGHETLAAAFFSRENLPTQLFGRDLVEHAYSEQTYVEVQRSHPLKLLQVQAQLGQRWIKNYLAKRPEPKFARFHISAAAILWNRTHKHVFTIENALPRVSLNGNLPPQAVLSRFLQPFVVDALNWQWVGLYENPDFDEIEFIFMASAQPQIGYGSNWRLPLDVEGNWGRNLVYIRKVLESDAIWQIGV